VRGRGKGKVTTTYDAQGDSEINWEGNATSEGLRQRSPRGTRRDGHQEIQKGGGKDFRKRKSFSPVEGLNISTKKARKNKLIAIKGRGKTGQKGDLTRGKEGKRF